MLQQYVVVVRERGVDAAQQRGVRRGLGLGRGARAQSRELGAQNRDFETRNEELRAQN